MKIRNKRLLAAGLATLMAASASGCAKDGVSSKDVEKYHTLQFYDEYHNPLLCLIMVDEKGNPKTDELYGYISVEKENDNIKYTFDNYFTDDNIILTNGKYKGDTIYYKPVSEFGSGINRETTDFIFEYDVKNLFSPRKNKSNYILVDEHYKVNDDNNVVNDSTDWLVSHGLLIPDFYEFNPETYYIDNDITPKQLVKTKE